MRNDSPLHYWDTPIFIAWLQNEKRDPLEMAGIRELVLQIHENKARLITSVITHTEVLRSRLNPSAIKVWENVFKRRNVVQATADQRVTRLSSEIRDYYQKFKDISGLRTLSSTDSIHLATAILYKVDCFYTFDEKGIKGRGLIPLSGNVAGYRLIICKPIGSQLIFGL